MSENKVEIVEETTDVSVNNTDGTIEIAPLKADFSSLENFKELYKIAQNLCNSDMIPSSYHGKPQNVIVALEIANRMNVSPFMVMQNLYMVKGKPSWSGQACISLLKASKDFSYINPIYVGKQGTDSYGCYFKAISAKTGDELIGTTITIAMAKAEGWMSNSKWKNMPEQMLAYRAASFFARIYLPNALMGLSTEGEVEDAYARPETTKSIDVFADKGE